MSIRQKPTRFFDQWMEIHTYDANTLLLDYETISYNLDGQPGFEFTRVLDRSQDSLGRVTGYTLQGSVGVPPASFIETQATYQYSATTSRISSISNPLMPNASFAYDYVPGSSLIDAVTGPAHTVDNVWEPDRDMLDFKENKVGVTTVSKHDCVVNELGQRITVAQSGSAFAAVRGIAWAYDALGQVTSADSTENTHDRAYQYDTIGNRKKSADSLTLPTSDNYTSNALNQYTAVNGANPVHDDDGNLTFGQLPAGSAGLVWDGENRLISSTVDGTTVSYLYDSQSRRIAKNTSAVTTIYLHDDWNVAAEYEGGTLTKTYLWGIDLSNTMQGAGGVGGLLAVKSGNAIHYPTFDGNGNVSEYLDSTGTPVAHFEYDPFGNTFINTDTSGQFAYRFSTKPIDAGTGLYYYGYRWYDAPNGRWPSRDPIGEEGGFNLYGFVGNNAVDRIDHLGLADADCSECNESLKKVLPDFQDRLDYLKKNGCETPITCECTSHGGYWDGPCKPCRKTKGKIVLSCKNAKSDNQVRIVLLHELIHALQGCSGKSGDSCEWRVCMEIQASYTANCAHHPPNSEARKKCVYEAAEYSTHSGFKKNPPCKTRKDFEDWFKKQYDKCAKFPTSWN